MSDALAENLENLAAGMAELTDKLTTAQQWDRRRAKIWEQSIRDEAALPGLIGNEGSYDSRAEIEAASDQALHDALAAIEAKARIIKREQRRRHERAEAAYSIADAMIEARGEKPND